MSWSPQSWRHRPATQLPAYPDAKALRVAESCLKNAPPLTRIADSARLLNELAGVANGRGFLLQGGDCAESFAEFGADKVRTSFNLLTDMAAKLRADGNCEIVRVARMAGQFAKPRSSESETIGGVTLPVYRGDIINGPEFRASSRTADPLRMLVAHRQAGVTIDLLRALSAAAYASVSDVHQRARQRLGLAFDHSTDGGTEAMPMQLFTSHEALLLNYEEALTRWDVHSERWWSTSAHMLWIGDRTRQLDGAHVEYARGIANPIGLKCGPSLSTDELLQLIDRLDPANQPGRLVLIGRFGAEQCKVHLQRLMRATASAGRRIVWSIDPMHGNSRIVAGRKTRFLEDILAEIAIFFEVARAEGVHPGGIHLELTGSLVRECVSEVDLASEIDLAERSLTHCDPRLNQSQALEVATQVGSRMRDIANARSKAA